MKSLLTLLLGIICNYTIAQTNITFSKNIKDPTAIVAGSFGGKIQAAKFKTARKIDIVGGLKDSAVVTSYTIYATGKGFESGPIYISDLKGNLFTNAVIELLQKSKTGTTIVIDDIKVKIDNVIKKVPSLTFYLY